MKTFLITKICESYHYLSCEADDLEQAIDIAKNSDERDDFERINYYVIEEDGTGDDYYDSSEEPDFVDQGE